MLDPKSFYQEHVEQFEKNLKSFKAKSAQISLLRLILFALIIANIYFFLSNNLFIPIFIALGILFAILLKRHQKVLDQIEWHKTGINVCKKELKALDQDYSAFDTGNDLEEELHPYSSDLDLFGEGSIYQMISRTRTPLGRKFLASWFNNLDKNEEIIERQNASKELEEQPELLLKYSTTGAVSEIKELDFQNILAWNKSETSSITYPIWVNIVCFTVFITTLILSYQDYVNSIIPSSVFLINLGLIGAKTKDFNILQATLSRQNTSLKRITELFAFIPQVKSSKGKVFQIQESLNKSDAKSEINRLLKLINLFDSRLNLLVAVFLNGLFLFDNLVIIQLNKWKSKNSKQLEEWMQLLGEFDALISLGNFGFNLQKGNYPSIQNEFNFNAKNIAHPLVPQKNRIGNDFSISNRNDLFLVTGSNMAGKSTFLRSIGVNMILAQLGSKVIADSFDYSPMPIYSSMRVTDSIQSGASTFFAEVDRIRRIIEVAKQQPIFVLLDEILKGTNSKDKYTGSKALIIQLSKYNTTGIIATHDLALGSLESDYPNIQNKRFEVVINNGDFIFDYKIKNGVCETMNATELMKKMGIEILE